MPEFPHRPHLPHVGRSRTATRRRVDRTHVQRNTQSLSTARATQSSPSSVRGAQRNRGADRFPLGRVQIVSHPWPANCPIYSTFPICPTCGNLSSRFPTAIPISLTKSPTAAIGSRRPALANSREGRIVSDRRLGKPLAHVFDPQHRRTIRFATRALPARSSESAKSVANCHCRENDCRSARSSRRGLERPQTRVSPAERMALP